METKTTSQVLTQQVKTMPQKPGVYLMRNEKREVIYVGKATNLKKVNILKYPKRLTI